MADSTSSGLPAHEAGASPKSGGSLDERRVARERDIAVATIAGADA